MSDSVQRLIELIDDENDVVSDEFKNEIRRIDKNNSEGVDISQLIITASEKSLSNHLKYLLSSNTLFDVNALDENGRSALHLCRNVECVELLLAAGADPNIRDYSDSTPLHTYCRLDLIECAEKLIVGGADVEARNRFGFAPLHDVYTASMVKLFIQFNADINIRGTKAEETPLMRCFRWGRSVTTVEAVLNAGADTFAVDHLGTDALCIVCENLSINDTQDQEFVRLLILAGAPLDARSQTPNHSKLPLECAQKKSFLVRLLLAAGAKASEEELRRIEAWQRESSLSSKRDIFLPFVVADPSVLNLLKDPELRDALENEEFLKQEKNKFVKQTNEWHEFIWKKCHQRVTDLAMIFIAFPTLVIAEICFKDQFYLTQLKYHLIVDRIESVKRISVKYEQ